MKIKELLNSPEKWTQSAYAKDAVGDSCSSTEPQAVCWCLLGAIHRCYPEPKESDKVWRKILAAITLESHFVSISSFNDNEETTFEQVRDILEMADV